MIPQQQVATHTMAGRHLTLMGDIRSALGDCLGRPARVLSFGCSTGLECLDLASVMPEAAIFGCEINPKARAQARINCAGKATILNSQFEVLSARGPFDAIVALNVLCRHPASYGLDDVSGVYPFAVFDEAVNLLDRLLAVGGVLTLVNGQYFFEDSSVGSRYEAIENLQRPLIGWIEKSLPTGERVTDIRMEFEGQVYSRQEWMDAVELRKRQDQFPDLIRYHHHWRQPELAGSRSTTSPLWRKLRSDSGE